jgi:ATP-dependent Clp protease ATP-binding subunit ClpC
LKRKIRMDVESELADALLRGDVRGGDRVELSWDAGANVVRVKKLPAEEPSKKKEVKEAA